jgi:hypothetical protein
MKARKSERVTLKDWRKGAQARRKGCPRPCVVCGIAMGQVKRRLWDGAGAVWCVKFRAWERMTSLVGGVEIDAYGDGVRVVGMFEDSCPASIV